MRRHTARHRHSANAGVRHSSIEHDIEKIKRAFSDTARDVKWKAGEAVSDSIEVLKSKSAEAESNVTDYVSTNPYKSLGLAALSGLLMGMYLVRRR